MPRVALARTLLVLLTCLAATPARADEKPAPGPRYVKPKGTVAIDARTFDEGHAVLAALPEAELAKLMADEIVLTGQASGEEVLKGTIRALFVVKQPRAETFRLLTQPSLQMSYQSRLKKSETVSRTENGETTEFIVKVGLVSVHTRVVHKWWPEISRMAWTLDPSFKNDLRHQEGFYNLYALDERTTLLEFGTVLEVSALVPKFVQNYLTRSDLPEALGFVKKFVDSGGKWKL